MMDMDTHAETAAPRSPRAIRRRAVGAFALAAALVGAAAVAAGGSGQSVADDRYHRAVADSGFDPGDSSWAQFAKDTCSSLRAGSGPAQRVHEVGVPRIAYVFGAAVGAYCRDQSARSDAWFHGQAAAYYGAN